MDDTTIAGGVLNQLGQTAKQAVKQTVKIPKEALKNTGEQISGSARQNPNEDIVSKTPQRQWQSNEEREKFLKNLYGSAKQNSSEDKAKAGQTSANPLVSAVDNKPLSEFQEQIKNESPEEQKKLLELRNQLHKENYYDPTFNPIKKQDERPAEKVENEKKQEMQELEQKDAKKPPPLAVVRERNKAEMFRGAAG